MYLAGRFVSHKKYRYVQLRNTHTISNIVMLLARIPSPSRARRSLRAAFWKASSMMVLGWASNPMLPGVFYFLYLSSSLQWADVGAYRALAKLVCTPKFGDYIINPAFANPDDFVASNHGKARGGLVMSLRGDGEDTPAHRVLFASFGEVTKCSMIEKTKSPASGKEFQAINWMTLSPLGTRTLGFMSMVCNRAITYKSYHSSFSATTIGVSDKGMFSCRQIYAMCLLCFLSRLRHPCDLSHQEDPQSCQDCGYRLLLPSRQRGALV